MANYPVPQQQQVLVPPLWTCSKCNTINGSNHTVCSSCGASKQLGQNQQVLYFAPNSQPTLVLPSPQKQSHVNVNLEIAALITVLIMVFGGIGTALHIALTPHPSYQYYNFQSSQTQYWHFTTEYNGGIIVAYGVTSQD